MTSVILISDDLLVMQTIRQLQLGEMPISCLTWREIASEPDAFRQAAIILSDVGDSFADCLKLITKAPPSPTRASVLLARSLNRKERLEALAAGVDHILPSPPDRAELVLVMKNLARLISVRRTTSLRQGDPEGYWLLDEMRWRLRTPLGHDVQLQRAEAAILAKLFTAAGTSQSREDLAASFKSDREDKNRSLDVAISKIRKKVRDVSNLDLPLRAIRGVGYVFAGSARLMSAGWDSNEGLGEQSGVTPSPADPPGGHAYTRNDAEPVAADQMC